MTAIIAASSNSCDVIMDYGGTRQQYHSCVEDLRTRNETDEKIQEFVSSMLILLVIILFIVVFIATLSKTIDADENDYMK